MLAAYLWIAYGPTQVRLLKGPDGAVLCAGKARYPLYPRQTLELDGGELKAVGPVDVNNPPRVYSWIRNGKTLDTLDFSKLLDGWLKQDDAWGGHSNANQMRYMAGAHTPGSELSGGGGLFCHPNQCLTMPDRSALGLLEIRSTAGSGNPIMAQFLVRYRTNPLRLDRLRLATPPMDPSLYLDRPSLYRFQGHVLFAMNGRLEELASDGTVKAKWLDLPKDALTRGLAAGRWLIGVHEQSSMANDRYAVYATDLTKKKSFALISYRNNYARNGLEMSLDGNPRADSAYLLFQIVQHGTPLIEKLTVHLPDGSRASVAWDVTNIAGPYAVSDMPTKQAVYSAKTGKRL